MRMGRPRKNPKDKRSIRVWVSVTPSEAAAIVKRALKANMLPRIWARAVLLEAATA